MNSLKHNNISAHLFSSESSPAPLTHTSRLQTYAQVCEPLTWGIRTLGISNFAALIERILNEYSSIPKGEYRTIISFMSDKQIPHFLHEKFIEELSQLTLENLEIMKAIVNLMHEKETLLPLLNKTIPLIDLTEMCEKLIGFSFIIEATSTDAVGTLFLNYEHPNLPFFQYREKLMDIDTYLAQQSPRNNFQRRMTI